MEPKEPKVRKLWRKQCEDGHAGKGTDIVAEFCPKCDPGFPEGDKSRIVRERMWPDGSVTRYLDSPTYRRLLAAQKA